MKIIGIIGSIGSGKSTVSKYLISNGFKEYYFSKYLKEGIQHFFGIEDKYLYGSQKDKEENIPEWKNINGRKLMQHFGTYMRDNFDQEFWIKRTENEIIKDIENGVDRIVISDIRYENELEFARILGANILFIERNNSSNFNNNNHESESNFEIFKKTKNVKIIENNDTLETLYKKIDLIIS